MPSDHRIHYCIKFLKLDKFLKIKIVEIIKITKITNLYINYFSNNCIKIIIKIDFYIFKYLTLY